MPDKYGTGADPYIYPNTNVLRNKLDIQNAEELELAERQLSELAIFDISFHEPPYNLSYWCYLHKQLFGDIYEWAGHIRTVDISKGNTRFCNVNNIEKEANKLFASLINEHYLVGYDKSVLVKKLAEYYSDLNVIHPFRDGNGRAQRLLFEHIVINCGYHISFYSVNTQQWLAANIAGYMGDYTLMAAIFDSCISERYI